MSMNIAQCSQAACLASRTPVKSTRASAADMRSGQKENTASVIQHQSIGGRFVAGERQAAKIIKRKFDVAIQEA